MLKYTVVAILLLLTVSCVPDHRTAVVYPSDDSFVWEFYPWSNFGTQNRAAIGKLSADLNVWWAFWQRRYHVECQHMWTVLKFDLTPYSGILIDSAKVAVYIYYTENTFPPNEVWVARCSSDWDEDTITWNNKPGYNDWHVPPAPVYAWWTIDVTAWVQEWLFDTDPNYGILIGTNATGLDWFHIYTKEEPGTTADPQLILYYTEYTSESDSSGEN